LVEMSDVFTSQEVLVVHANARLDLHGRCLLVDRGAPVRATGVETLRAESDGGRRSARRREGVQSLTEL